MSHYARRTNIDDQPEQSRLFCGLFRSTERLSVLGGLAAIVILFGLAITHCGKSGGGDSSNDEPDPVVVPLGAVIDEIDVDAGITMKAFVYDPIFNPVSRPLTSLEVGLEETLKSLSVSDPLAPGVAAAASANGPSAGAATVLVIARVADASG